MIDSSNSNVKLTYVMQVDYIEQNANMRAFENVSQQNAPWGLGRISHVQPGSDTYTYDASAGEGTCAYIIDSGLDEKNEVSYLHCVQTTLKISNDAAQRNLGVALRR